MSKIFRLCNFIVLLLRLQQVEPGPKLIINFKNESLEYKKIDTPLEDRVRLSIKVPVIKKFNETFILLENQIENLRQQNEELKAKLNENSKIETTRKQYEELKVMLRENSENEIENIREQNEELKAMLRENSKIENSKIENTRKQYKELKAMLRENSRISTGYLRNYDEHLNCLENCKPYQSCSKKTPDDGAFILKIPNSNLPPFYAYCKIEDEDSGWTVIQRRQDGSVNFNRGWHDYKHGFGDVYGEYWIGLERLHELTNSRGYELKIKLIDYEGEIRYASYSKFVIASEDEGYELTLGKYSGDAGDSFGYHDGMKFTTFDKQNDKNSENCAQVYKGGWWYKDCYWCNLNGRYFSQSDKADFGVNWYSWIRDESLESAVMQIRPW